jgi:hypothetical protein
MTHRARNAPTSRKPHSRRTERNTGTPTTNQMSRAPNRKKRAAESTLMARVLDRMVVNLALPLDRPMSAGSESTQPTSTSSSAPAMAHRDSRKPSTDSSSPPRKKPAPLSAFFEPVSTATHLKSAELWSSGTSTLMELLELILVRSFAMPERAWAPMT